MRTATPPPADQAESTTLRLTFLALLVVSLFVLLFARLWFLQVMAGERFSSQAQGNAVRTVTLEAPRGKILDRNGETIVRNRYAPVVSVQPSEMGDRHEEVYAARADMLRMEPEDVARRAESARSGPFRPRPIAIDVDLDVVSYIHEHGSTLFPGVYAETLPLRDYPNGHLGAHLLGYTGEISEADLESEDYEGYRPGDLVGRSGVEHSRERDLRGISGSRRLEVDARGSVLRDLGDLPPTPGADVRLTIELEAQRLAEEALAEGIELARTHEDTATGPGRGGLYNAPGGAAVVLDPSNGEVVAMASYPAFEPVDFVGGISQARWDFLSDAHNDFPLINRAIQSSYPPGSVYKVIPAATALEEGFLAPGEPLPCPPEWTWGPQVFRNWNRGVDEGPMDIAQSLVRSCDPVYYELARRMWGEEEREGPDARERMPEASREWGLGQRTGIDLPSERHGVVPGREWKREYWEQTRRTTCRQAQDAEEGTYRKDVLSDLCVDGHRWRGGDAVNMSIGQGDLQTTPLQIANAFAAIANRGTLYVPHVTKEIVRPDGTVETIEPEVLRELDVSRTHLDYIHSGLVGVTQNSNGTAREPFEGFPYAVAGKTGTAEYKPKQPIAWFVGYAPAESPRYVVAVMIEEGGGGSLTAAPIVRRILSGLLGVGETEFQPGVDIAD